MALFQSFYRTNAWLLCCMHWPKSEWFSIIDLTTRVLLWPLSKAWIFLFAFWLLSKRLDLFVTPITDESFPNHECPSIVLFLYFPGIFRVFSGSFLWCYHSFDILWVWRVFEMARPRSRLDAQLPGLETLLNSVQDPGTLWSITHVIQVSVAKL